MFTPSNYQELYWPVANDDDISLPQTLVLNTPLNLNGRFSNQNTYKNIDLSYNNKMNASVCRKITFTSGQNMSATNFVIYGRQNGIDIQEIVVGPNNATAMTDEPYDYIYRIEHTGVVLGNVSIGTHKEQGLFTITTLDVKNYRKNFEYGIHFIVDPEEGNQNNVLCNIIGSLKYQNGLYSQISKYFFAIQQNVTASSFFNEQKITSLLLGLVPTNTDNRALRLRILQV